MLLHLRVAPSAKQEKIGPVLSDGSLKVRITAPATDGKANKAVEHLFHKVLGKHLVSVTFLSGHTSRQKIIRLEGDTEAMQQKLQQEVQKETPPPLF